MLQDVRVVLSRPRDPRNIGAVCRAMKTMGLTRLYVAGDLPADLPEARTLAVHALDVLEGMIRHPSLVDAVRGCALIVGVSRRRGRWRKESWMVPEDLPARVSACGGSEVALVFGNEASGLSDEELGVCHCALHIPTSPLFPSLNLAQAVQIVAYVLRRGLTEIEPQRQPAVTDERVGAITEGLMSVFAAAGFFSQGYSSGVRQLFRDLLARAAMSAEEATRVERCFDILRALVQSSASGHRC